MKVGRSHVMSYYVEDSEVRGFVDGSNTSGQVLALSEPLFPRIKISCRQGDTVKADSQISPIA